MGDLRKVIEQAVGRFELTKDGPKLPYRVFCNEEDAETVRECAGPRLDVFATHMVQKGTIYLMHKADAVGIVAKEVPYDEV